MRQTKDLLTFLFLCHKMFSYFHMLILLFYALGVLIYHNVLNSPIHRLYVGYSISIKICGFHEINFLKIKIIKYDYISSPTIL